MFNLRAFRLMLCVAAATFCGLPHPAHADEKAQGQDNDKPAAKQPNKPAAKKPVASRSFGEPMVYKKVDGRELRAFVVKPADWKASDSRPAIVFFHGGGWRGGTPAQFEHQSEHLAKRGMVCVNVEYRLLSGDTKDPPIICIEDAKSAMRWTRSHAAELGIDPLRIAGGGGSAGGHLAAFVGMMDGFDDVQDDVKVSARANTLVLFNPVIDNSKAGFGGDRVGDRIKEFSPAHNVTSSAPPTILFVGSLDKLITPAMVEKFRDEMKTAGVRCDAHVYEGQEHGFFNYGNAMYYDLTLGEADKFLTSLGWLPAER